MDFVKHSRVWVSTACLLTALLAVDCTVLRPGYLQMAISDIATALLMLCALLAFASNALASKGRVRWFWILQAAGWGLWLSDQIVWIIFDLILRKTIPGMYPADALLFLAGAPMMAGMLLRPHRQPSENSARLGVLDFLLLLLWWLYLYVSFVVSWQYPAPNQKMYSHNFDLLSMAETALIAVIALVFWLESTGKWKRLYAFLCFSVVFNGIAFYVLNRALERGTYYTGSWYDIPYSGSFTLFTVVALWGHSLTAPPEAPADKTFGAWMANLAMMAVLSLPVIAFYALLDPGLPPRASRFRVLVTLTTMFLMAFLLFIQHHRLNRELRRTNVVLEEASLTDPLTGLRNRRYFSATIEGDVGQALRSHTDGHDPHTRDLVFYLIDADNFKEVNDRYGHDVGDKVLIEMARRLSSSIRHSDVLVRWGGEEFLIVSRYTDRREAELLAQRVLAAVADTPFEVGPGRQPMHRTCSMGWAAFPWFPENPRSVNYEEVLTLADRGLNRAKQAGKNRAVGMTRATGNQPCAVVEGVHSAGLQVQVLATVGPPERA